MLFNVTPNAIECAVAPVRVSLHDSDLRGPTSCGNEVDSVAQFSYNLAAWYINEISDDTTLFDTAARGRHGGSSRSWPMIAPYCLPIMCAIDSEGMLYTEYGNVTRQFSQCCVDFQSSRHQGLCFNEFNDTILRPLCRVYNMYMYM